MTIEIWDRTSSDVFKTELNSVEEGIELIWSAQECPALVGSLLWIDGEMAVFWERGKPVVDLRRAT